MKVNHLFTIVSVLLFTGLLLLIGFVFYASSPGLFFVAQGTVLLACVFLFLFYQRVIKPLRIIGNGMELLKEQDFSSRLNSVGQPEADRIVDIFNKMMMQLKNERLRVREQNHFLDLLITASPQGVIVLNLDGEIYSVNPAGCKMLGVPSSTKIEKKPLSLLNLPLAMELARLPLHHTRTVRLNDANIYKCVHSSFIDHGFNRSFYLIEMLTQEVFKAEKLAYEKVIRLIAHEVNNTTAAITSTLDTLEFTLEEMEGMEDLNEGLRLTMERCYGMNRFITRFADVVRIPTPQLMSHSLNEVVGACRRFMESVCMDRSIEIVFEPCASSPMVMLDVVLFEQVMINLIRNAAESIGRDGCIVLRTFDSPPGLEVIDNGRGIDKQTEPRLFTPFFSTKPDGQGIGLLLVREVLQKHGFTFSLRTGSDGLTRFAVLMKDQNS